MIDRIDDRAKPPPAAGAEPTASDLISDDTRGAARWARLWAEIDAMGIEGFVAPEDLPQDLRDPPWLADFGAWADTLPEAREARGKTR